MPGNYAPQIPPVQWGAAERCGKLAAQGILEVDEVVPLLYRAAIRAGYAGDRRGLRTRLFWRVRQVAEHWRLERDRAEWVIRRAVAPLVEAWSPGAEIDAAAQHANEGAGGPLLRHEVRHLVGDILDAAVTERRRSVSRGSRRNGR